MTELNAVLFVKQLLQEANTPVQKLWDEGNECFAKQDYDHTLQKYKEAIKICEEHDFEKDLAVLTCNMAAVHLKLNNFEEALNVLIKVWSEIQSISRYVHSSFFMYSFQHTCPNFAFLL